MSHNPLTRESCADFEKLYADLEETCNRASGHKRRAVQRAWNYRKRIKELEQLLAEREDSLRNRTSQLNDAIKLMNEAEAERDELLKNVASAKAAFEYMRDNCSCWSDLDRANEIGNFSWEPMSEFLAELSDLRLVTAERDKLQLQIESWKQEEEMWQEIHASQAAEIKALQSYRANYLQLAEERDKLKAEVERLKTAKVEDRSLIDYQACEAQRATAAANKWRVCCSCGNHQDGIS